VAPTTQTQIEIVKKAEEILDSAAKWDRASTQDCKPDAKTFGLYCLFAAASVAVTGNFDENGATINAARNLISVLRPAQASRGGIERLWNSCDLWLLHIERRVFPGAYFFTGAFFEYANRPGPIAEAIARVAREWFNTLRKVAQEAQEQEEIDPDAEAKEVAWELNGRLVGVYWAHLLGDGDCCREARAALLGRLRELATDKIPASAFKSVGVWKEYLQGKH
jgi:hypothetical protein